MELNCHMLCCYINPQKKNHANGCNLSVFEENLAWSTIVGLFSIHKKIDQ